MKLFDQAARDELRTPRGIFCLTLIVLSVLFSVVAVFATIGLIGQPFAGFRIEPTLTVSAVNESDWAGPKAGVKTYDRILKVNGQTYENPGEFKKLIAASAAGTRLEYLLQSKETGKERTVTVPVQTFSALDFVRSFLILYIVGFMHIFVGSVAYLIRPANPAARAHLFMTLAIGVTTTLVGDYDTTMLFPRVWIATVALTGGACLHLGMYFPQKKKILSKWPWLVWVPYIISFALLGAWEYAFKYLGYEGYKAKGITELFNLHFELYDYSLLWSLIVGFVGLIGLIVHSLVKADTQVIRNQAKVALLGAVVAYIPMTVFWMIMDQTLHIPLPAAVATLCWILFVVFPVAIAYAIIKHKMFDIDFVLKQSMTYSALIVLLGSVYVLLAAGLQQLLTPLMTHNSELTSYMLTTGVTVLLFEPLKLNIRSVIDKRFFRTKYDFRTALSEFIDAARTTIDVDELIPKLVEVVDKTIHPKHTLLFLKNPDSNSLKLVHSHGIDFKLKDEIPLDDAGLLAALGLSKPRKSLTSRLTGALNLNTAFSQQGPLPSPIPFLLVKRITKELPSLEQTEAIRNSLTLPLTVRMPLESGEVREEVIGLLTLGEKRSEMDYTIEDRQLFQSIGQQLALTVHSSQLAVEVAEKVAIKQTLLKARVIQKSMLPDTELVLERFEMTGFSESADETGGDYYDWYDLGAGRFIVGMGDVTGHGIDAAMVVGMAKSCLYNQVEVDPGVPQVMAALNRTINEISRRTDRRNRKLMSFVYSYFDSDSMTCRVASAGHWYPLLYRARDKEILNFSEFKSSFPLGQRPADKFSCTENAIALAPGDVLLYFTDGLHEAVNVNGQSYELERVEQLLNWYHELPASQIKERVRADWEQFIAGRGMDDDMTMVVIKVKEGLMANG
ncbi:MAG TPA: SpoIIE family protein phosphatase [Candidatus Obscuribacterales bacterium]